MTISRNDNIERTVAQNQNIGKRKICGLKPRLFLNGEKTSHRFLFVHENVKIFLQIMASTGTDDFENGWTLVDKDGQIDIEVSLSLFQRRQCSDFPRVL